MKKCSCCKSIRSLFEPKIRISAFIGPLELVNSKTAQKYINLYEVCVRCASKISGEIMSEIQQQYKKRIEELVESP